jgi:hypothetical protein
MAGTQNQNQTLPLAGQRRVIAAACLFGAEVIHVDVIDEYLREWLVAGLFFLTVAVLQGVLGVALLVGQSPRTVRLAIWLSSLTAGVWLTSRTVGLNVGPMPGMPEAVGWADSIPTFLELMTIAALVVRTSRAAAARRLVKRPVGTAMTVAAVTALAVVAVFSPAASSHPLPDLNPTCGITSQPPPPSGSVTQCDVDDRNGPTR